MLPCPLSSIKRADSRPARKPAQHAISQTFRNTRSVVSRIGKLTLAPTLKMQTSSGACLSASLRKAATSSSLRASSDRATIDPPADWTSFTSGSSFAPSRRPANTVNPSDANFLAISAPIKSPAPISAQVALRCCMVWLLTDRYASAAFNPATTASAARNKLLDLAQLFLAEKHFVTDKERRRAERTSRHRHFRVLDKLRLDFRFLRPREQLWGIEAGCRKRLHRHFRVIHFLRLDPHVVKRRLDIFLEHPFQPRGYRRTHQMQRIDRKKRIPAVRHDLKPLYEPLRLQFVKLALVLDAGECFGGRLVIGGLEDAAKQNRNILEFGAGAFLDCRDSLVAEESSGAADIEHELRGCRAHDDLPVCRFLYDPYHSTSLTVRIRAINRQRSRVTPSARSTTPRERERDRGRRRARTWSMSRNDRHRLRTARAPLLRSAACSRPSPR